MVRRYAEGWCRSVSPLLAFTRQAIGYLDTSVRPDAAIKAGLRHLYSLEQRLLLVVGETRVTDKGKRAIRRAIPGLKVDRDEGIY